MSNQIQHHSKVVRIPGARGPANAGPPAGAMTPKEILGILRRHVFMIFVFTMIGTVVGGGAWFLLQKISPKYTSAGSIEVMPPIGVNPKTFETVMPNKDIFFEFRATKAFRLRHQGFLQDLLEVDKVRETQWFRGLETVAEKVEDLMKNLRASAARDTSYINVSMTSGSAAEAKLIAEEAIKLFLSIEDELAKGETSAKLNSSRIQLATLQKVFDIAEASLKGLRESTTFGKLDKSNFRDYLDGKLESLENASSELDRTIESAKERVNILTIRKGNEGNTDFDDVVRDQVERDPVAIGLRNRVDAQEVELRRLKSQFGDSHKRVKETAIALEELKYALLTQQNKVSELYRSAGLITAMEDQSILEAQLVRQDKLVQDARDQYRDVNMLRADYDIQVTRRDEALAQLEEMNGYIGDLTTVLQTPALSKVKMGMTPSIPLEMSSPKLVIFIPGGFMLGFMLGVGLAFAIEMLNDLLRAPSDVMKHLRAPLLGTICHKSEDKAVKRIELSHVVRDAPYSIMSEAYRQFRTNLKLSGAEGGSQKTLLVTSGSSGDGRTTVAVNTAYTFIADNKRVLLIDTNFRKPATTVLFGRTRVDGTQPQHPDLGLSNYLMGQSDESSVIRSCDVKGLDIIDSGPLPQNPSELLGGDQMVKLIKTVRENYDYVIIDGPPLLVSESKALASIVDGTIVVFNAEQTKRGAAQRALRELREVNANVIGTVLLGVKSMKGGYFHEVYDSYQRYQDQEVRPSLKA